MRPLRAAILLAVALTSLTRASAAQEGLYLTWNDCPGSVLASSIRSSACDNNVDEHRLYVAFSVATPVDSVLGVEIVVDLQTTASAIPEWWRFDAAGCRYASLTADGNYAEMPPCIDLWGAFNPSGALQSYTIGMPRGGANQARMRVALGIVAPEGMTVSPGGRYLAARLTIGQLKTIGDPECPGCGDGVCLVLNSIILKRPIRPPGVPSADVLLVQPGPMASNWAIWQGGTATQCQAVPVRHRTWGEIKSIYR